MKDTVQTHRPLDTHAAESFRWSDPACHTLIVELVTFDYGANPRAVIALANYRTAQQMCLDLNQPPETVRAWDQLRRDAIRELQAAFTTTRREEAVSLHWLVWPLLDESPASLSSPLLSPS